MFATLTAVGVDNITTKGHLLWGFNGWTFHSFTRWYPLVCKCVWELSCRQEASPRPCHWSLRESTWRPASVSLKWGYLFLW
jgi:hypothetical protein